YPRAAPAPQASPRPHGARRQASLRVLVVEDVELNRSIVGTLLEDEGHSARFAVDGYGALELHEREAFDTILLDIHLPDLDGMEVARRIRRHPDARKAGVRIVALTASITTDEVGRYREAGVDAVVGKPFDFDELIRSLHEPRAPPVQPVQPPLSAPVEVPASALVDTRLLATHFARLGGDRLRPMMDMLAEQGRAGLAEFAASADPALQRERLHRLVGMAANLGLVAFSTRCRELERTPLPADLRAQASALQPLFEDSIATLRAFDPQDVDAVVEGAAR
ncbi:PAS sensor protein, partial [Thauera phenylacetica B4P]